jgi:hypothetical protein
MPLSKITTASISTDAATANTNIDNGTFFVDVTNNRVGVGITTPTYALNVKGPSSDYRTALFETASTNGPSVQIKGSKIYELRSTDSGAGEGAGNFFIYDKDNEQIRLKIDSSGRVTTPAQPYFYVRPNIAGDGQTVGNPFISGAVATNTGSHYNNTTGRFTAPVTGVYVFGCNPGYKQTNSNFGFRWRVNGGDFADMVRLVGNAPDSHSGGCYTFLLQLAANDFVDMIQQYSVYHTNTSLNHWSGYLLG